MRLAKAETPLARDFNTRNFFISAPNDSGRYYRNVIGYAEVNPGCDSPGNPDCMENCCAKGHVFSRDLISEAIRSVIDQVVITHFPALTQEHQLTSRIAGTLEAKLNGLIVNDYSLRVIAQEIPDKGPGTLESKTGIDLYIGIELVDRDIVSKGILIQAKWAETKRSSREQRELVSQCEKMTERSPSSYVWLYGPDGADVVPAEEVVQNRDSAVESLASRKTSQLFQQILDCFEGDRKLALPLDGPDFRSRLSAMLQELDVKTGIEIAVTRLRTVDRPRRPRAQ